MRDDRPPGLVSSRLKKHFLAASVVVSIAACTPGTTVAPASAGPAATANGGPTAASAGSGSAAPTSGTSLPLPSASGGTFEPAAVTVELQRYASVPGGPLAITAPSDGSGRLFVAAQDGRAWVVEAGGRTRSTPLLDIRSLVTSGGERGLLGIALHPGFPSDGRVYVDYTDRDGNTVVASYQVSPADADVLDPSSARVIFRAGQPFPNHNGGALAFGPDGDLYVSLGDGGSGGDPFGNGQKLDTTLGKILRIDVDHPSGGRAYGIPADNPFAGDPLKRGEIWLYGLRNPWRMSFDPATGNLWIGDVGQAAWEEIDVDPAGVGGLNYGWNRMEGSHCYQPAQGCDRSGLTLPVAEYDHSHGCAVIGGVVYRGSAQPILDGAYLYSDNCSGTMWALGADARQPVAAQVGQSDPGVAGFGVDQSGEVYVANLDGTVSRVVAATR